MKIYAIYRMYYGEDFIVPSIMSILPFVDRVFVFRAYKPFGHVTHFSDGTEIPMRVDECEGLVFDMMHDTDSIVLIRDERFSKSPNNQFTLLYNNNVCGYYPIPDAVLTMETDMVWDSKHLEAFIDEFSNKKCKAMNSFQVEFWHNKNWRLPQRRRPASILHRLDENDKMPGTGKSGDSKHMAQSKHLVYNFGFCVIPRNMLIKHELALQYSKHIRDCQPYENWYREVWLEWTPGKQNLAISKNHRGVIKKAVPADIEMPEPLKNHTWNPDIFTPRPD